MPRMHGSSDLEQLVRSRLRSLRTTLGLSLDEVAARSGLGPSTISRVETGKRAISLDVLVPLASALGVDLDTLLGQPADEDVVIRSTPHSAGRHTTWMLSRPTGGTIALKMRFEPVPRGGELRVHPGHDWFFVLEGRVRLALGEREVIVETGEAAEFDTMTPHALAAMDEPAEVIMLVDRDGRRAHVPRESGDHQRSRDAIDTPTEREFGFDEGVITVPDDFDDPLPDEIQRLFEG